MTKYGIVNHTTVNTDTKFFALRHWVILPDNKPRLFNDLEEAKGFAVAMNKHLKDCDIKHVLYLATEYR